MAETAGDVFDFWVEEVGPDGWYGADAERDATIRDRFELLWERGRAGLLDAWRCKPRSCLALILLLDQFPRNMFREDARAFSSDPVAVGTAKIAVAHGHDLHIDPPQRQFFYLPFMHSESRSEQERSVRLALLRLGRGETLRHAVAHREIIRRYGRFPHRNAVLGRESSPAEIAFLEQGGYGRLLDEIAA